MHLRTLLALTALAGAHACVQATEPEPHNPVPYLERLEPEALAVSADGAVVEVVGRDFTADAQAFWEGDPRPTEFESSTLLRVTLDPEDVARAGSGALTVANPEPGGGRSAGLVLRVVHGIPEIDSILPREIEALSDAPASLRIFGRGFTDEGAGSRVTFGDVAVPTSIVSDSELEALVGEHMLQRGRSWSVHVVNPTPGGGRSAPESFVVLSPLPVISGVSPDSVRMNQLANIHITGDRFMPGATVWLDTIQYEPSFLSRDSIWVHVSRVDHRGGVIRVENPGPGEDRSAETTIGIQEAVPVITSTWPLAFEEGGGAQTMRITGSYFAPDAVVTWNSAARETVVIDENTREITVEASEVESAAQGTLRVWNPRGGGDSPGRSVPTVPRARVVAAFANSLDGAFFVSRLDGTGRIELPMPEGTMADWVDTWPTGDEFLYTSGGFSGEELFRRTPEGEPERVTDVAVRWPRLSRDGAWVYFGSDGDILRMRPDGTDLELVVEAGADTTLAYPDPSPSGDRLLYSSIPGGFRILDLGTGEITSPGAGGHDGQWSPDGTWIAYRKHSDQVWLVRPDGTEDQVLMDGAAPGAGGFDWSPDGRFLLTAHGSLFRLVEVETGRVLRIVGVECPCTTGDFPEAWRVSWYFDPSEP